MEVTSTQIENVVVVALNGRLDSNTYRKFEDDLLGIIDHGNKHVLLDFSQLDYISSAGLRVLLMAAKRLRPINGKIALCGLMPSIKTVFDIAGFSSVLPIYASQEEAVKEMGE